MRRKRNDMTYGSTGLLSLSESQGAFADASALVEKILGDVKKKNPQMKLNFKKR